MNRIDWIVLRRLAGSILLTMSLMFAIIALVESLNTSRFAALSTRGGVALALVGILGGAMRWMLDTLPLTILVGSIVGLLDLQSSRELTIIKSAGFSVWRLLRPAVASMLLLGLIVSLAVDTATVELNRALAPVREDDGGGQSGRLWIEQRAGGPRHIIDAAYAHPGGAQLDRVSVFLLDPPRDRIEAAAALLEDGHWRLTDAIRYRTGARPERLGEFVLPTSTTRGDMRAKLSSVGDMTVFELASTLASRINDQALLSATLTRFVRLLALPLTLAGSLVIAFAFTAGYRRTNRYGGAVLYGIVMGFAVYVVAEMAQRAGAAGAIQPVVAVVGPVFVAFVVGVTVLLYKEDGRA